MEMDPKHAIDQGRSFDWGKTASDYAEHRPGPPKSFYARLAALGVGLKGQAILDLGTGTGLLARNFAAQGCHVTGIDPAAPMIASARAEAERAGLQITWKVAPAEHTNLPDRTFDAITANQCWLYFDHQRVTDEVRRMLKPQGVLVYSHFSWLPRLDKTARLSEGLILRYNPAWTGGDWPGVIPAMPERFAASGYTLTGMFQYDEDIPFTAAQWRGRIRACRGVGAALAPEVVERFDAEHAALLSQHAGDSFSIKHRICAHLMTPFSPGAMP